MKSKVYYLLVSFILIITISVFYSCKKDEEEVETSISIDTEETELLDIGDEVTAIITIISEEVKTFSYSKVVDNVSTDNVDAVSGLVQEGNTYTYNFSYTLEDGDDLGTLGFEFEIVDKNGASKTVYLLVKTNLSMRSTFIKYDWTITAEEYLGASALSAADSMKIFRFSEDGTYEVDLSADYAASTHHFCYWAFKETADNGDTLAVLRLVRRLLFGDTGVDEYYQFRITEVSESEMTMYWDIDAWGMYNIKRTFTSKAKGDFQPYGTKDMQTEVEAISTLDCSNIDGGLLTID